MGSNRASLDPTVLLCLWRDVMGHCLAENDKLASIDAARMSGRNICLETTLR